MQTQIGNNLGVTAKAGKDINGGDDALVAWNDGANQVTISAMQARLQVVNAGYYTSAVLNAMTFNDLVYALRQADAASTI